jgi:hypothetical protein
MTALLLKLLGARADDVARVADVALAFRSVVRPGWVILCLSAAAVAVWAVYRLSPVQLSRGRRWTLTVLRALFLALILMLLLQPVLALTIEGSVRRTLVLLLDGSASMQIKDVRMDPADQKRAAIARGVLDPTRGLTQPLDSGRARELAQLSRLDVLKSALRNHRLQLLARLAQHFDLEAYAFGQGLTPLAVDQAASSPGQHPTNAPGTETTAVGDWAWVDRLKADAPRTALGDALREVLNRKRGQPLAGVLVATDGANNSGSAPHDVAAVFRQEGVPIYAYGVGITSPRDVAVVNLFAPETTFVQEEMPLTVRVRSQGFVGQTIPLVLRLDGQQVAAQQVQLTADAEQVVPLRFTPTRPGEFTLQAALPAQPQETLTNNNAVSQRLRVIDAKIKVLLVDGAPRWEFRYLQAMLLRDRRVQLKCWLAEGSPSLASGEQSPYLERFPDQKDDLFKFDLVILGDVDPKVMTANRLDNLNELVSRFGGALVVVAGKRFTPHAYRRTALDRMLPVEFDVPSPEADREPVADRPIRLALTPAGRASPFLRLSDKDEENVGLWSQLPPVYWVARVLRAKPAAEVLLVDPEPAHSSRFGLMPVLALHQYGLGTVVYVGTDNTWRWRKNVGELYYRAVWGQLVQRAALPRLLGGARRTQLSSDRQNYVTGERIRVYARLYTAGFDPVQAPAVKAYYSLHEGSGLRTEVQLRPVPEQPGLYQGEFVAGEPGPYRFWVEQDPSTTLEFSVSEPKFEFGQTALNEPLLRDLATLTGGAYFREEDLYRLPDTIQAQTERVRLAIEVPVWSSPLYFLLLVGLATAEWLLRRRSDLK